MADGIESAIGVGVITPGKSGQESPVRWPFISVSISEYGSDTRTNQLRYISPIIRSFGTCHDVSYVQQTLLDDLTTISNVLAPKLRAYTSPWSSLLQHSLISVISDAKHPSPTH